jgi:FemAB-related protein (PEP-CTERM system-associated)
MSARGATITAQALPSPDWDAFVTRQAPPQPYWHSGWVLLARDVFGHTPRFLEARDSSGTLLGVLPLVRQSSLLLGSFITSLPFFNYGGALCEDDAVASQLMQAAREWAVDSRSRYLEIRDVRLRASDWQLRTDKVSMILDLPDSFDELGKQLGSKLRSQVKRADRENPVLRTGGMELLDDFYDVFARNMRDLGTPVYPRRFFGTILERFADACRVLVIYRESVPHAAGCLVFHGSGVEIPWASCTAQGKTWGFNMRLYWDALALAIERGTHRFDFGRSTLDSGTFRFKKQWGAKPLQLHWHRWDREPAGEGRMMEYATAIWQRLPLGVANVLGPLVSPSLPW